MQLQKLLAENYWGWETEPNANWIEAIVCISGVLNGSTLPYMLGCDKQTGLLTGKLGDFLGNSIQLLAMAGGGSSNDFFDFDLDQWIGDKRKGNLENIVTALEESDFAKGQDNLAFDLTLQGCLKANQDFEIDSTNHSKTNPETYYLSIVTEQTTKSWLSSTFVPDLQMNPVLVTAASYQGQFVEFDKPPISGWGTGDLDIDKWRENDGAVSSIS